MEQVIYIEEKDKEEASLLSKSFTNKETSARAYINSLGAELAMKYLAQEGIDVSKIYNMHSINKIREEFELADIILPNVSIDVRMIYDENLIFIPKTHFEYDLLPDIYVVFKFTKNSDNVKFLGYFEPKLINKKNQNDKYYFIEKEKLSAPQTLKSYIDNFSGNNTQELSEEELNIGQRLALSFIDNDIKIDDKKQLLSMLKKSANLREDLIEFDNFEVISYHVTKTPDFNNPDIASEVNYNEQPDEFDVFEQPFAENDIPANNENDLAETDISPVENLPVMENISTVEENLVPQDDTLTENTDVENISTDIPLEPLTSDVTEVASEFTEAGLTPLEALGIEPVSSVDTPPVMETEDIQNTLEPLEVSEPIEDSSSLTMEPLETLEPLNDLTAIDETPLETDLTDNNEELGVLEQPSLEINNEIEALEPIEDVSLSAEPIETLEPMEPLNDLATIDETPLETTLTDNSEQLETLEVDLPDDTNLDIDETNNELLTETNTINDISESESIEPSTAELTGDTIDDTEMATTTMPELSEDNFDDNSSMPSDFSTDEVQDEEAPDTVSLEDFEDMMSVPEQNFSDMPTEEIISQDTSTNINDEIKNDASTISNQDMTVGEIQLNINTQGDNSSDNDKLEVLYDKTPTDEQEIQNNTDNTQVKGKKGMLAASAIFVMLVSVLLFSTFNKSNNKTRKKAKTNKIEQNIPNPEEQALPQDMGEVQELNEQSVPQVPAISKKESAGQPAVQVPKGPAIETPYLEVKRLSWSVPNYLSYNDAFRKYLQTAGKSLKLTLSSDLLLATEYSYSNKLEVSISYSKDGEINDIKMLQTSGSEQIDEIVLRTVKETTNILKPPTDAIVGDNLNLTLIIYL